MNDPHANTVSAHPLEAGKLRERILNEDLRNKRMMKNMYLMYVVLVVFYTLLFLVNPDPALKLPDRIAGLCGVLAFVIGAILFRREHRTLSRLDYSVPLTEMLRATRNRFRFLAWKQVPWLLVLVLIDGMFTLMIARRMGSGVLTWDHVLTCQGIYWGIMLIAGIVAYFLWRKRSRGIMKEASDLLDEIPE